MMATVVLGEAEGRETLINAPGKQSWADFNKSEVSDVVHLSPDKFFHAIHSTVCIAP